MIDISDGLSTDLAHICDEEQNWRGGLCRRVAYG